MSNLKPGDKVMLVWACCAKARLKFVGWVGTISKMERTDSECCYCKEGVDIGTHAQVEIQSPDDLVPVSWLIKMPPDSEIKHEEETYSFTTKTDEPHKLVVKFP